MRACNKAKNRLKPAHVIRYQFNHKKTKGTSTMGTTATRRQTESKNLYTSLASAICALVFATGVQAIPTQAQEREESLPQILAEIYQNDPGLAAARASLRATNQGVSSAQQEVRTSVALRAAAQLSRVESPGPNNTEDSIPRSYGLEFSRRLSADLALRQP